tara:strand:+ start:27 stop:614 length:588 start_codon:yes stop_codon:yes gene_type:complete
MEKYKKKFLLFALNLFLIFFLISASFADVNFNTLKNKKVSYLDFFLLKYESALMRKAGILASQMVPTRVQYSNIGVKVSYDNKKKEIHTEFHAIMDKYRYSKRKYKQKISDCNQVRNLILYKKHGYKFFSQKRDPNLSTDLMENLFKENFFDNSNFNEQEVNFLLNKMLVKVIVFHPINKTKLSCSGKINDYMLK